MPNTGAATGSIDEDPTHGLSGSDEEMLRTVPRPARGMSKPQPGLMNQRRGLQSLPRLFVGHFLGGQSPEFVVDHGEQLGGIGLWLRIRQPVRIGARV